MPEIYLYYLEHRKITAALRLAKVAVLFFVLTVIARRVHK